MRSLIRPGTLLAIAAIVVAVPTVALGALSGASAPAGAAANTASYQDSTGEDSAAPDITTIVVSNDDAGMITFRINVPNRPQLTSDIAAFMFIDGDANQGTGDPDNLGAEYIIQLIQGEVILFKWDGSDYTLSSTQSSLTHSWSGGATIRISASDLGNTRRFGFDANILSGLVFDPVTGELDLTNTKRDSAPTFGFYSYQVKISPPTLVVKKLTTAPAAPAAGKPFAMRLVAARSDTGAVVQNGRVTCIGRVGSARLKAQVQRVVAGAATCTWNIPAAAKGKRFQGSVAVAFEGLKASQGYASKVR